MPVKDFGNPRVLDEDLLEVEPDRFARRRLGGQARESRLEREIRNSSLSR